MSSVLSFHNLCLCSNPFYRDFIQQVYKLFGKKWTLLEWKLYIATETPKQLNAYDCGIFSLKVTQTSTVTITIDNLRIGGLQNH